MYALKLIINVLVQTHDTATYLDVIAKHPIRSLHLRKESNGFWAADPLKKYIPVVVRIVDSLVLNKCTQPASWAKAPEFHARTACSWLQHHSMNDKWRNRSKTGAETGSKANFWQPQHPAACVHGVLWCLEDSPDHKNEASAKDKIIVQEHADKPCLVHNNCICFCRQPTALRNNHCSPCALAGVL